jgi:putative redox protein
MSGHAMTSVHHIASTVATTGVHVPTYLVELRAGSHRLVADEPEALGGANAGPVPFALFLSGLAACTAITLRMYAERKNWFLESVEVDARYDISEGGRASIDRTVTLPASLSDEQRDRLAEIAERTPVTVAVRAGTPIATTIRIVGTDRTRVPRSNEY